MLTKTVIDFAGDNKRLFKCLHERIGFDYNKPFRAQVVSGRFTVNSIKKLTGYNPGEKMIILLKPQTPQYMSGKIYAVEILANGFSVDVSDAFPVYDTFYRKSDFDMCRKQNDVDTLAIIQDRALLCNEKSLFPKLNEYTNDVFQRYRVDDIINGCTSNGDIHYISQCYLYPRFSHGEKVHFESHGRVIYSRDIENYPKTIYDIVDRSGYYVRERRAELKRRAAALRVQREKAAFVNNDYTKELETLEVLKAEALKMLFVKAASVNNHDELLDFARGIDNYSNGLTWTVRAHELFAESITEKKYSSPAAARRAFDGIVNKYNLYINE